jgi:hypothetical protein
MSDHPSDSPSSEELIRRARDDMSAKSPPGDGSEPPAAPEVAPDLTAGTSGSAVDAPADAVPDAVEAASTVESPIDDDGASLLPEHFRVDTPAASGPRIRWGLIVGVAVVAFFVFRWFTADTPVDDLAVGDCFMSPTEEEIETVETVECGEPHDYEVFAFVTLDDRSSGFPGDIALFEEADEKCFDPFLDYVDEATAASPEVYYDVFIPGESSWDAGTRESMCAIFTVDDAFDLVQTEGSMRSE